MQGGGPQEGFGGAQTSQLAHLAPSSYSKHNVLI